MPDETAQPDETGQPDEPPRDATFGAVLEAGQIVRTASDPSGRWEMRDGRWVRTALRG